jgi:hypothetical protein
MKENPESLLIEIQEALNRLEAHLPRRVDGFAVSPVSQLPFKVLRYRAALVWRMAELVRSAFGHFEKGELASASLLTRAAMETTAAMWYLHKKVSASVESGTVGDIDEYLFRLLVGMKNVPDIPQAVSVGTFLKHIDKEVNGFSSQYGNLSEIAHPNWAGTSLLYSAQDTDKSSADFGVNIRAFDGPRNSGVLSLSAALLLFEERSNRIDGIIAPFIAICEKNLRDRGLCSENERT